MAGHYCPIFDVQGGNLRSIGLWALNPSALDEAIRQFKISGSIDFGMRQDLLSLAQPTLEFLAKAQTRRVSNSVVKIGKGVRFENGVFIMLVPFQAPSEELRVPNPSVQYTLQTQHGIPMLKRRGPSPNTENAGTVRTRGMKTRIKNEGPYGTTTDWFRDDSRRSGPKAPSEFNLFEIAHYSLHEWAHHVSADPRQVQCTVLPISKVGSVTQVLYNAIKRDHGLASAEAVKIFDEYLGAACPKCFAGLTGSLLQTISSSSKAACVIGGGDTFQRILGGRCASCDSDTYYVVWHGDMTPQRGEPQAVEIDNYLKTAQGVSPLSRQLEPLTVADAAAKEHRAEEAVRDAVALGELEVAKKAVRANQPDTAFEAYKRACALGGIKTLETLVRRAVDIKKELGFRLARELAIQCFVAMGKYYEQHGPKNKAQSAHKSEEAARDAAASEELKVAKKAILANQPDAALEAYKRACESGGIKTLEALEDRAADIEKELGSRLARELKIQCFVAKRAYYEQRGLQNKAQCAHNAEQAARDAAAAEELKVATTAIRAGQPDAALEAYKRAFEWGGIKTLEALVNRAAEIEKELGPVPATDLMIQCFVAMGKHYERHGFQNKVQSTNAKLKNYKKKQSIILHPEKVTQGSTHTHPSKERAKTGLTREATGRNYVWSWWVVGSILVLWFVFR